MNALMKVKDERGRVTPEGERAIAAAYEKSKDAGAVAEAFDVSKPTVYRAVKAAKATIDVEPEPPPPSTDEANGDGEVDKDELIAGLEARQLELLEQVADLSAELVRVMRAGREA